MFWLKKKLDDISHKTPGFEETGERKTPLTGVVLLVIMFIAGVFFGWNALDDVARLPTRPAELSYCGSRYRTYDTQYQRTPIVSPVLRPPFEKPAFYNYDDSTTCVFNDLEKEYDVDDLIITKRVPLEQELKSLYEKRQPAVNDLYSIQDKLRNVGGQYNLGLQERQAGLSDGIYPISPVVQQDLLQLQSEEALLQKKIDSYGAEEERLQSELRQVDSEITAAYKLVFTAQNRRERVYEFEVFLIQFAIVFPLFLIGLRMYLRLLGKNSPYAVIFTAVVAVVGVLLLRIILQWFWGLFLARVIEVLFEWFQNFELVRSVVFYLGMMLSFVIFGGAVYYLQKKIFDPRRVTIRRFRSKQCPHCQTSLDLSGGFCPNCGEKIRMRCGQCGVEHLIGLPFCQSCGVKI